MSHRSLLRVLLACLLLTPLLARADTYPFSGPGTDPDTGIRIEMFSFHEEIPNHGFAPVEISITNHSNREGTWRFFFTSSSNWSQGDNVHYEATVTVPSGESKRAKLLVPLAAGNGNYSQLSGMVEGPGLPSMDRSFVLSGNSYSGNHSTSVGMSSSLSDRNWNLITSAIGTGFINGSPFDLQLMPTDWRGFTGVDQIWMTDEDWQKIGAAERTALLEWVALGRTLFICREQNHPLPLLPDLVAENQRVEIGFGEVRAWTRAGDSLDIPAVVTQIQTDSSENRQDDIHNEYRNHAWKPLDDLPKVRLRSGLLFSFLLIFALVIGPVNLFYFARGTRRYRLFWTTPAISLGASALMFLLILFQDGTGGRGYQRAVWHHFPDQNKAVFLQEQVSRSALLTGRRFETENLAAIYPIKITDHMFISRNMSAGDRVMSGDYFRNRSIDAHLVEAVAPTRWRIERAAPDAQGNPQLLSTFAFPIRAIYYIDENNDFWHAENLQPGSAQPLQKSTEKNFSEELARFRASSGQVILDRVRSVTHDGPKPGHFFAFTENAPGATEKTLSAIRWQSETLHTGPVVVTQP